MITAIEDPRFRVRMIARTPNPQVATWIAMHQDYCEDYVGDDEMFVPDETHAGHIIVARLLNNDRGHYGPLEHPQITFATGFYPHSVMQQARTHRIACSFDVQSGRYTGARFCKAATGELDIESVFYLRPPGHYKDRQGHHYEYTEAERNRDKDRCLVAATLYKERIDAGWAEEHARGLIPFDFRQHFVVSFTARSLMHFLDLRCKADAQLEIQHLAHSMVSTFDEWMPQVAQWYAERRLGRGRLAP